MLNRFHIYSWRKSKHRKYLSEEHLFSSDLLEQFDKNKTNNIDNDNNNNQKSILDLLNQRVDKSVQESNNADVINHDQDDTFCEYSDDEEHSEITSNPPIVTDEGNDIDIVDSREDNITDQLQSVSLSPKLLVDEKETVKDGSVALIDPSQKAALLAKLSEIDNNEYVDNGDSIGRFQVDEVKESPTHASPPNNIAARKATLMMELFGGSGLTKPLKTSLKTSSSSLTKSVKFQEDQVSVDG